MVSLTQSQLETEIHDCGLYKAKAKNLLGMCRMLLSDYHGEVPEDFDELVKLPGVGRKTANVVRSVAFGYPAIAVDTHVFRVANRLKLAAGTTPLEVEKGLQKAIPKKTGLQPITGLSGMEEEYVMPENRIVKPAFFRMSVLPVR